MKKLFFTLLVMMNASISSAEINQKIAAEAKAVCLKVFEKNIIALFDDTNAESVRMSSRISFTPVESKKATIFLAEALGNFYVKWPANKGEVPRLAGANMVYSIPSKTCKSVGIIEFSELKKR